MDGAAGLRGDQRFLFRLRIQARVRFLQARIENALRATDGARSGLSRTMAPSQSIWLCRSKICT